MKKMNMVSKFAAVKAMLNGEAVEGFTLADALTFIDERIVQTEKKNASGANAERKPTKEQIANEGIKEQIVAILATCEAPIAVKDLQKNYVEMAEYTCQKISALLTQLIKAGKVVRTEVKGKALFELA